jgi:hypothetical protein
MNIVLSKSYLLNLFFLEDPTTAGFQISLVGRIFTGSPEGKGRKQNKFRES